MIVTTIDINISAMPISSAITALIINFSHAILIKFTGTHNNPINIIALAIVAANVINGIFEITIYKTINANPIPNFGQKVNSQGSA